MVLGSGTCPQQAGCRSSECELFPIFPAPRGAGNTKICAHDLKAAVSIGKNLCRLLTWQQLPQPRNQSYPNVKASPSAASRPTKSIEHRRKSCLAEANAGSQKLSHGRACSLLLQAGNESNYICIHVCITHPPAYCKPSGASATGPGCRLCALTSREGV